MKANSKIQLSVVDAILARSSKGHPGLWPVCFIGSSETSPIRLIKGDSYVKAHGIYSKHKQRHLKMASIMFGIMIGVGLVMLCLDDCMPQMRICMPDTCSCSRVSSTSWEESQHCCAPEEPTWEPASPTSAEQGIATCPLATSDVLPATNQPGRHLELIVVLSCSTHTTAISSCRLAALDQASA